MATQYSTQLAAKYSDDPQSQIEPEDRGTKKILWFDFTQSGAGSTGDLQDLVELPPGPVWVLLKESWISSSAMGTARTMDLGHRAYTQPDGTAVAADPDDLDANVDVSSAAVTNFAGTLLGVEAKLFDSKDGVVLGTQINDAAIPAGATLTGYITIVTP